MGRIYKQFIEQEEPLFVCKRCKTHLTTRKELWSKKFKGRTGSAYLFDSVKNLEFGEPEHRELLSGMHEVASAYCIEETCGMKLGWKYTGASDINQTYKIGKIVLERKLILIREQRNNWIVSFYYLGLF